MIVEPLGHVACLSLGKNVPMATFIMACCFCQEVRDELANAEDGEESWVTLQTYRTKYQLTERELRLSHTYCPGRLTRYKHLLFGG
ncbi:MAG: hypothetical protein OJF52_002186 [Nitrospira sp.]|jgi:hypothetical protein|nr:MAG: hypothetical protein OJF52_002186 [Nitrospira sp.]